MREVMNFTVGAHAGDTYVFYCEILSFGEKVMSDSLSFQSVVIPARLIRGILLRMMAWMKVRHHPQYFLSCAAEGKHDVGGLK